MELKVYNHQKKEVGKIPWPEALFGEKPRKGLIHQVVVQQAVNRRQGNAHVKSRHHVSGSTRKIYRQKGTGRARHGDIKAPLFVGGGRAFGPRERDWVSPIPREIRKGALRDLLLVKQQEGKFWIVDDLGLKQPKTKEARALFTRFGIDSGLVILAERDEAVEKSIRNLPRFKATLLGGLEARDLLLHEHLVMTPQTWQILLQRLGGSEGTP